MGFLIIVVLIVGVCFSIILKENKNFSLENQKNKKL